MSLSKTAAGAGLTGTKMARRVGSVDEFEFKAIGENHNQGVSFVASILYFMEALHFSLRNAFSNLFYFVKKNLSV